VAVGTVYNWVYQRKLPTLKVGSRLPFPPRAVRRLRQQEHRASGDSHGTRCPFQ